MREISKQSQKHLSEYNRIQSGYRYHYPETKPEQHKKGISTHLLFTVFFVLAGFLFYLTQLSQSVIASGATREGVLIAFSFLTAGIFLILFKGARS